MFLFLYYYHPFPSHHPSLPGLHHQPPMLSHSDFRSRSSHASKMMFRKYISNIILSKIFQWFSNALRIKPKYSEFDQKWPVLYAFFVLSQCFLMWMNALGKFKEVLRFVSWLLCIVRKQHKKKSPQINSEKIFTRDAPAENWILYYLYFSFKKN